MKKLKLYITEVLVAISSLTTLSAQCLDDSAGIGTFETAGNYNSWFKGTQSNGTISHEMSIAHSGSGSLKAEVTAPSSWQVRIFNTAPCALTITQDKGYQIGFWIKTDAGNQFVATLNDGNAQPFMNYTAADSNWNYYTVNLIATASRNPGDVRFNFNSVGTYYIDDIIVHETDCNGDIGGSASLDTCGTCSGGNTGITPNSLCVKYAINLNDPDLRYNGTISSDVTTSYAKLFRFRQDYIANPVQFGQMNARTQAGISISLKTNSPIIDFHFDTLENSTKWGANFAIFEDGQLITENIAALDFSIQNLSGTTKEYEVYLPGQHGVFLSGIELVQGYSLSSLTPDNQPLYVAIGNSITHGVGQTNEGSHLSYGFHVADSLGYRLHNLGIGGSGIYSGVMSNLDSLPKVPEMISVLWGYNNTIYNPADLSVGLTDYDTLMTRLARDYPNTIILGILQTYTSSTVGTNPANTITRLRTETETILQNLQGQYSNVCYIDGWNYTGAGDLADVVHLNDQGAENLANGIIANMGSCSLITSLIPEIESSELSIIINIDRRELKVNEIGSYELADINGRVLQSGSTDGTIEFTVKSGAYILNVNNRSGKFVIR